MQFSELITCRESVRAYDGRAVPREALYAALDAARLAPSACNSQPWHAVIVDDPQLRTRLAPLTQDKLMPINRFTDAAPAFIAVCETPATLSASIGARLKANHYASLDVGIFTAHLALALADQGLGSCILGWFSEKPVREPLKIPANTHVRLILAVGYPAAEAPRPKKRRTLPEITSCNQYGKS